MAVLRGFLWLLGFLLLGDALVTLAGLPVSAGVVGMLLLTAWLMMRGTVSAEIAAAAQPLIGVLAMLIMPGVVGIFFIFDTLAGQWLAILAALVGGTLLSVFTTLWLMRRLMGKEGLDRE
ncbi:CidA/LrgA family protein [Halomonas tibetensis]|uniref:CidA/LrgA family protein n=1 Tax=Halomonas tibetensis TaxID=2259590 RepID=A0ABV7B3L3_9GAMM